MNEIYVTGHRNPDTDSVVAALSYTALRNALGTARSGGCRLLSAHKGAEATRTPATTATAPK